MRGAGDADDEGHAGAAFPDALFLPQAVLAEVVAVIAMEDDDGLVSQAEAVQGIDHLADLGIHEGGAGKVALFGLVAQLIGELVLIFLVAHVGRRGHAFLIFAGSLGQLDLVERVHVEVLLGRDIRGVRAVEADGEVKWLVLVLLQQLDRGLCAALGGLRCGVLVGEPA